MAINKDDSGAAAYTTAEFRKDMAEIFAAARYSDAIVDVSHHGKPWVSIMSSENAESLRTLRDVGDVELDEVTAIVSSLRSPIKIDELAARIREARKQKQHTLA